MCEEIYVKFCKMGVNIMYIAEYKEKYKNTVIDLLSQGKDSDYFKKRHKIWNWQYIENPFSNKSGNNIVVFEEGILVGFTGLMPVQLNYMGNIVEAYWSVDAIIDPIYRGKGYGGKMVNEVKIMRPIVMAFGISDIQSHIRIKNGYKVNKEIEEYFYVLKLYSLKNVIKKFFQYMKIFKNISFRLKRCDLNVRIIDASDSPKQIDHLWEKVQSGYSNIVIRNYLYIKWKYGNCPLAKYQLIIVERGNELVGLGVFIKNKDKSRLVDYVGPAKGLRQIKYLIVKTFKKECSHSRLLSCICTDIELKKSLEILGFIKYKHRPRFYIYSNIENDRKPESNWFIMAGDSDGDFAEFQNS